MSQNLISVSSLNTKIKSLLEATFMHIFVEGEVASVTYHTSGHVYFSIKDESATLKCVMWRSNVAKLKFRLEKGMHIVIEGSVGVYTPRGEYQFYAVKVEPYGQGALALAYEQLKNKLKEKGYFDPHTKKPIPKMIKKLALVTAKESAALQDMLKVIEKRWPLVEVLVIDSLVQGEQAAGQIARGLHYADSLGVDVVVVGRGGGSVEDLWAFNEEAVADAIYAMHTPVVSAVGHEVDTLISDFVADLRAPTPSAAIEMILPDKEELLYTLSEMMQRLQRTVYQTVSQKEKQFFYLRQMHQQASPLRRLQLLSESAEKLKNEFGRTIRYRMETKHRSLPELLDKTAYVMRQKVQKNAELLDSFSHRLELLDPQKRDTKGWAQLSKEGKVIAVEALNEGDYFMLQSSSVKLTAKCLGKSKI